MGSLVRRLIDRPGHLLAGAPYVSPGATAGSDPTGSFDYLIGDSLGFISAVDQSAPYRRSTAQFRKQQIDTSTEPGEQSINAWWLRSQSSFHCGAGRKFAEQTDSRDVVWQYQFHESQGVDVWTAGQVKLQPATVVIPSTSTVVGMCSGLDPADSSGVLYTWAGSTLTWHKVDGSDALTSGTVTWGGSGTILDAVCDGTNVYVADATGVYAVAGPSATGSQVWDTGSARVKLGWVKQRLIAGIGNKLYELPIPNASLPATTLPTPNYTHPASGFTWTAITEGPAAIYVAGYIGDSSTIYKILLDASVDPPTLTPAISAAQLPFGEIVHSLVAYMSGYLVVGSSTGIRVCVILDDGSGNVYMLAPTVRLAQDLNALPCYAAVGDDRFIYASLGDGMPDGTSGLVRIDLSQLTADARFAWATDLQAHQTGPVLAVTHWGDRLAFLVEGAGVYFKRANAVEPSGFLTTGRVRFHTLEPKIFKYLLMRAAPLVGGLQATVYDTQDASNLLALVNTPPGLADIPEQDLGLPAQEYASFKFTLFADGTGTLSPEFRGYQVKALPAAKRQRQEQVPLLVQDFETDRNGNRVGYRGFALQRLLALEALEEGSDAVVLQHLTADPEGRLKRLVVIDQIDFLQTVAPTRESGWGGIAMVTFRSIT